MNQESTLEPGLKELLKPAPGNLAKKPHVGKRVIFVGIAVFAVVILVVLGSTVVNNLFAALQQARQDAVEQRNVIQALEKKLNELDDKLKSYKSQSDAQISSISQQQESLSAITKKFEAVETNIADLNQESDDKFGRLSKEINDVRVALDPMKESVDGIKAEAKELKVVYEKDYKDLQDHVTRAAGLVAQLRDETNKKLDFLSMVQEKMLREANAMASASSVVKSQSSAAEQPVVHRQVINAELSQPQDQVEVKSVP